MLKQILKRIYHLPGLLRFESRATLLRLRGARISRGAAVSPVCLVGNPGKLTVGCRTFVGRATIYLQDNVTIGENVVINDGVSLLTGTHDVNSPMFSLRTKPIKIEAYSWICTGAVLLPGVTIGEGAVVGAYAVVTRDVAPFTVVAGNPARWVKERSTEQFQYDPVAFLAPFEAWCKPVRRSHAIHRT